MNNKVYFYQNNPCIIVRDVNEDFCEVSINHRYAQDMELTGHCMGCTVGDSDNKLSCTCEEYSWIIEEVQEEDHKMIVMVEKRLLQDNPVEFREIQRLSVKVDEKKEILEKVKKIHEDWVNYVEMLKLKKETLSKEISALESKKSEMENVCTILDDEYSSVEERYNEMVVAIGYMKNKNITQKEYDNLLKRDKVLSALEAGGVDNWEWYSESLTDAGL